VSLATNSPIKTVFILMLSYLVKTIRTRSSTISLASSKNWRDSICLKFITAPVSMRLSNAVSISRHFNPALYPAPTCTKRSRTASFKFSSRAIQAINDCFTPIDNRGRLIRLCSSSDSINSSQRCSHAINSSRVFNRTACSVKSRSVCPYYLLSFFTVSFLSLKTLYQLILKCNFYCTHYANVAARIHY